MIRLRARALSVLALLGLLLPPPALAQRQMTAAQLITFIRSSIQMRQDDRQVADFVRKVKLSSRLDARTVEDLEGQGAGPRTVAALTALGQASASLPVAPPPGAKAGPAAIPAPDAGELKRILAEVTENALSYSNSLPNFICTQVTRRHVDPTGTESWRLEDTIQEHLSYVDRKEEYKVVSVNNVLTNATHAELGGARSQGEFGSMLFEIFQPETHAHFDWERWATLRGRRMYVFSFRVPQRYSKYSIYHQDSNRTIVAGYHGLIYADRDTKMVMRVRLDCDSIPADFPVQQVSEVLDYDFVKIAGQQFVLPLKVDMRSTEAPRDLAWNEIEFHLYRKFGADTSITFDTPDPIPQDQLQEQPAK
ncbi:MAG TPA: hypothetical protein VGN17_31630 [Bryobacteraceae bacterium]|jgi:hypothetical protein